MGDEKTRVNVESQQKVEMTPEERTLLNQNIEMNNFMRPYTQKNFSALSDNIYSILQGQEPAAKGIGGINDIQTQEMVNASMRDIMPSFQSAGILDSGMAAQMAHRTAGDIRNQNAQFNVGAAQNLFNLASGGQSNLQGQYQGNTNSLVGQLAGLRTINNNSQQLTRAMNPFLKSFQQSLGSGLGTGIAGGITGAAGGGAGGFSKGAMNALAAAPPCWVASEIFGGWYHPKTIRARYYVNNIAPNWFRELYMKYGESIAKFISNKPLLKNILKPLFEMFARKGDLNATINSR